MRILVLSDLHSNATALDAVLDAAKDRWDLSVCLGDVVGYGIGRVRSSNRTTSRGYRLCLVGLLRRMAWC